MMALLAVGQSIPDAVLRRGYEHLYYNLYSEATGGWAEQEHHRPTVYGTSHAIVALDGLLQTQSVPALLALSKAGSLGLGNAVVPEAVRGPSNSVFVVHGHDAARHQVARFLELLGLKTIILDEQLNTGTTTVFQKFLDHAAEVGYAVVLATPDDIGGAVNSALQERARQNVIFELGFFIAKLGLNRICLLTRGDLELPSDIRGVITLDLDSDAWQLRLARELRAAGFKIDVERLF
jgi:hypothetical protein